MCGKHEHGCRCHRAVMNGYTGMKNSGAAESEALDAAFHIFRFHHPDVPTDALQLTVERWVYAGQSH